MGRQVIRLGPGECSDVETGARYFSALAFPSEAESQARENAVRAQVSTWFRAIEEASGNPQELNSERSNDHFANSPEWCRRQLRTFRRRLRDRSLAARAVRPWVRQAFGHDPSPIPTIDKFNQRQIALFLFDNDEEAAIRFVKRKLSPTRPVLPLAVAQDVWLCTNVSDAETDIHLPSPNLIQTIVAWADVIERRLLADPRFRVKDESLLRLQWVT